MKGTKLICCGETWNGSQITKYIVDETQSGCEDSKFWLGGTNNDRKWGGILMCSIGATRETETFNDSGFQNSIPFWSFSPKALLWLYFQSFVRVDQSVPPICSNQQNCFKNMQDNIQYKNSGLDQWVSSTLAPLFSGFRNIFGDSTNKESNLRSSKTRG